MGDLWEYELWLEFALPAALIVFAFFVGSWVERRHFRGLIAREDGLRDVLAFAIRRKPRDLALTGPQLVCGSAVISVDYFKKFAGDLRGLVGGRIGVYESLMERARREALVRMKQEARRCGRDIVLNVKLGTARIYAGASRTTVSVEALAYGTAYIQSDDPAEIQQSKTA